MPKRKAVYNSIRSQMRANGELADTSSSVPGPGRITVKKLRNQHMRNALDASGEAVAVEWKEDYGTMYNDAHKEVRARKMKRIQKRSMLHDAADSLHNNQRRAGADTRGIKFVELEEGIACKIIPIKFTTKSGKERIVASGFDRYPDGTIVTALFNVDGSWRWEGNVNITCMLPDGRAVEIPKTRLEPMVIGEDDEEDDLFAPEDD